MATIPFVLYGIFRYTFIIQTSTAAGSPEEVLLHDRPLQFTILLWGILDLIKTCTYLSDIMPALTAKAPAN